MKKSEMKRMVAEVFKTYEKAQGVKAFAVKNDDYNPRANDGLYVLTVWAEFVSPSKGKDTETISVKRGYKDLNSAIGAAQHVKTVIGRNFLRTSCFIVKVMKLSLMAASNKIRTDDDRDGYSVETLCPSGHGLRKP